MRQENWRGIVNHKKVLLEGVEEVLAFFLGGIKVCILTHGHMYEGDIAKSTSGRLNVRILTCGHTYDGYITKSTNKMIACKAIYCKFFRYDGWSQLVFASKILLNWLIEIVEDRLFEVS